MSSLVRAVANENAQYVALKALIERIQGEPKVWVHDSADYFGALAAPLERRLSTNKPGLISIMVIPTLTAPSALPLRGDRTIITFHSRPDQMLGSPYRYYPLLHELGHVGKLHARGISYAARNAYGFVGIAVLLLMFANPVHCVLLMLLVAFACWAYLFRHDEGTLQAEIAADHFALKATHTLTHGGFFSAVSAGGPAADKGPLYGDASLYGVDDELPERLQRVRKDVFERMRRDTRSGQLQTIEDYCEDGYQEQAMRVEGLLTVGFVLALACCSLIAVRYVQWPGILALSLPIILVMWFLLLSASRFDLGERLLTLMRTRDPQGMAISENAAADWTKTNRPRYFALLSWLDRFNRKRTGNRPDL
jgi:hypothetical protein